MKKKLFVILALTIMLSAQSCLAVTKPAAPKAKASEVTDVTVTLKWNKVKKVSGYEVFRYKKSKKKYVLIKRTKKRAFKVKGLKPYGKYAFKVRSFRKQGKKRKYSSFSKAVKKRTYKSPVLEALSPSGGKTVSFLDETMKEFIDNYSPGSSLNYVDGSENGYYHPVTTKLNFSSTYSAKAYVISLSENSSFKNKVTIKSGTKSVPMYELKAGKTYYWKVSLTRWGRTYSSKAASFKTADEPVCLKIGPVLNTRDFGGRNTDSGARVKQGMVYRSGNLDSITASDRAVFINRLGIKTDLDLRLPHEISAAPPLGGSVKYVNKEGISYYYDNFTSAQNMKLFASELKIFADRNNYPMIIHCVAGKDRTGMLMYTFGALLGMDDEDLMKDYELSYLEKELQDGREQFCLDGMNEFRAYINSYGDENDSLREKTEKMLIQNGLTSEEIERIRSIMLENR